MTIRTLGSAALIATLLATAASGQTYFRGSGGDPETLDQHKTSTVIEANLLRDLYEGLVIYDANAQVMPGVAESWSVSDDGTVYTFTLRDDARWSNGDPVVADDFVYSLRRIQDPATGAEYANILYPILNAEAINSGEMATDELGVRAIDDHTLEITLAAATPFFLELLTHQTGLPVHPATVEALGDAFVQPGNMISNGAYTLVSFTPNSSIVMERNPEFHSADTVQIDRVEYLPFEDRAACIRGFEAGEVHSCSDLPTEQLDRLRADLGDQIRIAPYLGTYYYAVNTTRIESADVRHALSMAIDREFVAEEIWSGTMIPAYSWVPPGIGNYDIEVPQLEYADMSMLDREDAARAIMEAAGYSEDNRLEVEIAYNTSENHRNTATAIADMWSAIHVDVVYNVRDVSAHYGNLRDAKDFDVARAGWIGDYSDPQNFLFLVESDNDGFNYAGYRNPDYDALMDAAAAEVDLAARAAILGEAEAMFLRDIPQIPILFYSSLSAVSDRISGWEDNVQNAHATRFMSISE